MQTKDIQWVKKESDRSYIFFALTYVFSWSCFAIGSITGALPIVLLGIWGPTITALILTAYFYGTGGLKDFLKRFRRVRVAWIWWLLLLLLPALIHFTGRSLWQLVYNGELNPHLWISIPTIITSFLIAGFGEELGWRGFALPRLQMRFSPLVASIILAAAHFFWHLPTYWLGQGIHNVPLVYALAFIVPWTIIFTWIYNRSKGSLLFAVSFHAISNISLSVVRFMPLESEVPISPELITQLSLPVSLSGPYLMVVAVYWLVAIAVLLKSGLRPPNTDIP